MPKRIVTFFVLISSFFPIFALSPANAENGMTLPGADFADLKQTGIAKVVNVIDPLTIQLDDGRLIRLTGLNYPDYSLTSPGELSMTALQILRDMLTGQSVYIYQTKDKELGRLNRMGHHIAHLQRQADETWMQGTIVALGLAQVRTSQRNREMAAQLYALENNAREQKLGLWAEHGFHVLSPEEASNHLYGFEVIEGTVRSASLKKNRLYLNFGENWREDFTVSIPASNRRLFSKAGLDPLQWNDKRLRVRGWVDEYNGPYIEVDHPEAVEVLGDAPTEGKSTPSTNESLPDQR